MTGALALFASRTGGPPFLGSVGYVNDAIAPLLSARGWSVTAFQPPSVDGDWQEALLPLGLAAQHAHQAGQGRPDVALYDCAGTVLRAPSKTWADRHVILYHGMVYGTGNWLTNEDIDLHCGNSPYAADVLRALFAMPDWHRRRVLNPHGLARVTDVRLPVPCVEAPDGHPGFAHGADAPAEVLALADRGIVLGHALQPGKQDLVATVSILYWLNRIAREHGRPRVLLLISETSLPAERRRALDELLAGSGFSCADLLIPVPHLQQRALVKVMRACRFGLAYNRFPEPFGFYVLESVFQGCPVYTNGAGNNRYLLPAGHGIEVYEHPGMAPVPGTGPDLETYRRVAERILADIGQPAAVAHACDQGRARIAHTFSMQGFGDSLDAALTGLDADVREVDFEELQVDLSPMVRSLDLDTGTSFNDYGNSVLSQDARAAVRELLGQRAAMLGSERMETLERRHRLFSRGLLTLRAGTTDTTNEQTGAVHS